MITTTVRTIAGERYLSGIVVHADSYTSGHGPGLAVIMSSRCGSIEPILDPNANIANYLHIK